nr:hypothetical protein Q903MT_gene1017 [Picea sitchensis]
MVLLSVPSSWCPCLLRALIRKMSSSELSPTAGLSHNIGGILDRLLQSTLQ